MARPRAALHVFLRFLLLALLPAGITPASAEPGPGPVRNVLILHSYQDGPEWVKHVSEGILSVLDAATDFSWVYRFEYMNVLDADPAGVPVVFCTIDNYSEALLKGERDITGVVGIQDFLGTLMLAWRLHPGFRHLLVLVNRQVAAERAAYRQLARLIREELPRKLDICPQTVVIAQAFLTDDDGRPLSLPANARQVSEALEAPMYSCWETLLGNGIVGGMITGGL